MIIIIDVSDLALSSVSLSACKFRKYIFIHIYTYIYLPVLLGVLGQRHVGVCSEDIGTAQLATGQA